MSQAADRLHDQVLVLRCQTGDDRAFAELVERYHRRLAYYVGRLLGNRAECDDAMQNVWLSVYRKLPTLRSPQSLTVWLYRIARNAAMGQRRERRAWIVLAAEPAAPDGDVAEALVTEENAARIHAALDRLEPAHREVLTLRFLEEMSYDDIAAVTGCPVGTVRSRLYYAKAALERIFHG